MLLLKDRTAWA